MYIDPQGMIHNDGAYLLNGRVHGNVGEEMQQVRWEPGLLRPYLHHNPKTGRQERLVTINTGRYKMNSKTGKEEPVYKAVPIGDLMRRGYYSPVFNATTLQGYEWVQMDEAVRMAARQRLSAWDDLASSNTYGGFDGMSKLTLEYDAMADFGEAVMDMEGLGVGRTDSPLFKTRSMPLPIIHADFYWSARRLAVSRNGSVPLDTASAEQGARRVAEMVEQLTIGTISGPNYGGQTTGRHPHDTTAGTYTGTALGASTIYGYTNFPHRITYTSLATPTGSNPEAVMANVIAMRELAYTNKYYGPFMLYTSTAYDAYLDNDYFRTGGTSANTTLRERIKAIAGIKDVKRLDYLTTGYQMILVQQTPDVARAVKGMDITTVQWESKGGMQINFKIMCIMVPQLRSDYNGNTGIVHGTAS